jgi:hypothetical protein
VSLTSFLLVKGSSSDLLRGRSLSSLRIFKPSHINKAIKIEVITVINDTITMNATEEICITEPVLLSAGFSVSVEMADFPSVENDDDDDGDDDDVTETGTGTSVICVTVGDTEVLQSASFRTSQCWFSYSEGSLQVKFGNFKTLLEL